MAPYAKREDVQETLQVLPSSDTGNASLVSVERIDMELEGATAEIDARLSTQYVVPFDPVPELIRWICEALAAHRADLTFRETRDLQSDMNPVYMRYLQAMQHLDRLASGEMVIPPPGNPDPDPGYGTRVVSTHTRDALVDIRDFDIDPVRHSPDYWTPEGWAIH